MVLLDDYIRGCYPIQQTIDRITNIATKNTMNTYFGDINILHQARACISTNVCYFQKKKNEREKSPKRHKQCKSRMFSLVHIQIVIYLFLAEFQEVMHSLC